MSGDEFAEAQLDAQAQRMGLSPDQAETWKERVRGPAPSIPEAGATGMAVPTELSGIQQPELPPPQKMSKSVLGLDEYGNPNIEFGWGPKGPLPGQPGAPTPEPPKKPTEATPERPREQSAIPANYDPAQLVALMNQPQPVAPLRMTPGGWQHGSRSAQVQQAVGVDPEARAAFERANQGERGSVEDMMRVGMNQADAERAYLDRMEQNQAQREQMQRDVLKNREMRLNGEMEKLMSLRNEAQNGKIDEREYFNEQGNSGAFVATFGNIVSSVGAALTHTENDFMKALNARVAENINAQKTNLENKHRAFENQGSLVNTLVKQGMNADQAEQGAWAMYLDRAKTEVAKIALTSKDVELQARAKAAMAAIDKEQGSRLQAFKEASTDKVVRQEHDVYRPPGIAGGPAKADPKTVVHMPDGTVRVAANEESAQKAKAAVVFQTAMKQINTEALTLRSKRRDAIKSGDYRSAQAFDDSLKSLQERRIYALSNAEHQGVVRDPEYIRAAKTVDVAGFDWNPLTAGHTNKFLEEEANRSDRAMESEVRVWAPEVAQHGYGYNAQGQLTPTNQYIGEARTPPQFTTPKSFKGVK